MAFPVQGLTQPLLNPPKFCDVVIYFEAADPLEIEYTTRSYNFLSCLAIRPRVWLQGDDKGDEDDSNNDDYDKDFILALEKYQRNYELVSGLVLGQDSFTPPNIAHIDVPTSLPGDGHPFGLDFHIPRDSDISRIYQATWEHHRLGLLQQSGADPFALFKGNHTFSFHDQRSAIARGSSEVNFDIDIKHNIYNFEALGPDCQKHRYVDCPWPSSRNATHDSD